MLEYNDLVKQLEDFCKKTGMVYHLNLAPDPEAKENKYDELKDYLNTIQNQN